MCCPIGLTELLCFPTGIQVKVKMVNSLSTRDKNTDFENSVHLDEVAHNEPPHLGLHCLPSSL